jgi:glycosyltransferase involved in cell wall biosynthesis
MKICFIAPGEIKIPPNGWGALETVLWNQFNALKKLGEDVYFINENNTQLTYKKILEINPDVVHLHYGKHWEIMPLIKCKKIVTSHDGSFLNSLSFHEQLVRSFYYDCDFFVLTTWERDFLLQIGISPNNIKILPNGVDFESFTVSQNPNKINKSICLGKIDKRKNQAFLQKLDCGIDFVGQNHCTDFNPLKEDFLGMWNREQVFSKMTEYANLILVSNSELQPLVCLEALSCGLGLVISKSASQNLDESLPFISVIEDEQIKNKKYIKEKILENRKFCSAINRQEIVNYAKSFSWENIAKKYIKFL